MARGHIEAVYLAGQGHRRAPMADSRLLPMNAGEITGHCAPPGVTLSQPPDEQNVPSDSGFREWTDVPDGRHPDHRCQ